ncbi:MAG: dihydroorotase, partial [Methanomicrobiaceae archaeon]|nr:dihydroorotase [Methanomicrobiaceae archaeon]
GTVEVTPHHLFLSWEQFDDTDASVKVNPPLRRDAERRDLWLCWDRIDVIASDHAPHTLTEKSLCMREAPPGIPGVQTMVPLLVAQAYVGRVSLASIVEKTSTTPASILGIPRAGFEAGDRADFALYPERTSDISLDQLYSKCDWSPYEGRSAVFPVMVIMRGDLVYREGEFFEASPRWFPGDGYIPPQSIYYTADTAHL